MVIKKELQRIKCTYNEPTSFDTMDLINYLYPTGDQRDLEEYATILGTKKFERHRALGDVLTTAHLFVELVSLLEAKGVTTLSDLLRMIHNKIQRQAALF